MMMMIHCSFHHPGSPDAPDPHHNEEPSLGLLPHQSLPDRLKLLPLHPHLDHGLSSRVPASWLAESTSSDREVDLFASFNIPTKQAMLLEKTQGQCGPQKDLHVGWGRREGSHRRQTPSRAPSQPRSNYHRGQHRPCLWEPAEAIHSSADTSKPFQDPFL